MGTFGDNLILALTIVFISLNVESLAAHPFPMQLVFPSPHPPPPHPSPLPSPSPDLFTIEFVGEVLCYKCYDQKYPQKLQNTNDHLQGVMVQVTCASGTNITAGYGETNSIGKYNITLEQNYEYLLENNGEMICDALIYAPPKNSLCNIPTSSQNEPDIIVTYSKGISKVVVEVKPFAFATDISCQDVPSPSPSPSPAIPPPRSPLLLSAHRLNKPRSPWPSSTPPN